jgi:phage terminase small subunit
MPRGGHNRKSKAQAERDGTARDDRHADAVTIAPGTPIKPVGMSVAGSALWDQYVPLLVEGGVLEQVDGLGLAQMFEAYVLATTSRTLVGDRPVMEVECFDEYGNVLIALKKHPGVTSWKDAVGVLRGLLADYGLSPLARTRLADAVRPPGEHGPILPGGAPPVWTPTVVQGGKADTKPAASKKPAAKKAVAKKPPAAKRKPAAKKQPPKA